MSKIKFIKKETDDEILPVFARFPKLWNSFSRIPMEKFCCNYLYLKFLENAVVSVLSLHTMYRKHCLTWDDVQWYNRNTNIKLTGTDYLIVYIDQYT